MRANVVIDLEMCGVQIRTRNYNRKHEIVQIGAVMMNEEFELVDQFSSFVRPDYGKIDYFISSLTGISDRDVKKAPSLSEALTSMMNWIGDREVRFYAWSESDYNQLRNEIIDKQLDQVSFEVILDRENWIDYQKVVGDRFDIGRSLKLADALNIIELDVEGRLHDGLADAINTAKMIAKLELNPDYKCAIDKLREKEAESEPLTMSLGSLLKGFTFDM